MNRLGNLVENNEDGIGKNKESGVYKLVCTEYPKDYSAHTGRMFKKRIKNI